MKEKKRMAKREGISTSGEMEALVKETQENLQSWQQDPSPLLQKLRSFPPERQEDVFLSFLKQESEEFFPLLEALMVKEE